MNFTDDTPRADDDRTVVGDGSVAGIPYRWVAMGMVLFGTFMVVLDTTVVNLALPSLQREFDTVEGIEWVVTSYLAAVGVAQMCSGWTADRFGRKASFLFAMGLFTFASILCAAAVSLPMLIAARVLQGVGGGMLMPVAMAMIYELFEPHERGEALGWFGIAVMAAPAIGPVLGGSLISSAGWRWLFLINVPIGAIGLPIAARLLLDTGFRERRRFDRTGLVLTSLGLTFLLVATAQGGSWGWSSPTVLGMLLASGLLLTAFVLHSTRTGEPLVEMRILANPVFAIAMVTMALMAIAQYSRLVYIPLQLGTVRGISEFQIGLTMLPSALGIAITMPIGGRLADRIGARVPVSIGLAVLAASFWGLVELTPTTSLTVVAAVLFAGGLGSGLAMMAPNIVAMNSVEARRVSQASGLSSVARQVSAAVGIAILAAAFAASRPDVAAGAVTDDVLGPYRVVFVSAIGLLLASLAAAQFLPGKRRAIELQEERRREMDLAQEADFAAIAEIS